MQTIPLAKPAKAQYVKFELISWSGDGGGLRYFDIERGCQEGWTKLSTGCYMYKENSMTWAEAKAFCEGVGAKLVVVESEAEKEEITKMAAKALKKRKRFWVGVKKVGNDWKTLDGVTTPTYTPWGGKIGGRKGDCIRGGPDSRWYTAICTAKGQPGYPFNPFCKK